MYNESNIKLYANGKYKFIFLIILNNKKCILHVLWQKYVNEIYLVQWISPSIIYTRLWNLYFKYILDITKALSSLTKIKWIWTMY